MRPLEEVLATRQARFYAQAGLTAFAGTVPFRLSTSRAMASVVAHAAHAFAQRLGRPRVCIVDVGAGTGRLAFHLLAGGDERLRVVATDASAALVDAWRAHPQLAALLASGRLTAHHAPATALGPALACAPDEALVVCGTYLLDTLPHALLEAPGRRALVDAAGALHFAEAQLDAFSRATLARLGHGRAFLPTGAFAFLRATEAALREPALLLVADKGALSLDDAREDGPLRLARHGEGASVSVNFDALRAWLGWRGWAVAPGSTRDFVVAASVLHGRVPLAGLFDGVGHPLAAQGEVTALRPSAASAADAAPARDDAHASTRPPPARPVAPRPEEHAPGAPTHPHHESDASRWWQRLVDLPPDGDAVLELADAMCAAPLPDAELRGRLGEWLLTAVREAFFLPADDVAFQSGRVLYRQGFVGAAAACFSRSLEQHGETVSARVNRALCLAQLGEVELARADLDLALETEPGHAGAAALRAQLER